MRKKLILAFNTFKVTPRSDVQTLVVPQNSQILSPSIYLNDKITVILTSWQNAVQTNTCKFTLI